MIKLIAEWSNYIFIFMCVIYAISCFTVFLPSSPSRQAGRMNRQEFFMFLFHFICYGVLFAVTKDQMVLILYVIQAVFFKVLILIYQHVYPDCSRIMVNHMCFLMMIGFVMLSRIGLKEYAIKQFAIAGVFSLIVLALPVFVEKAIWLRRLRWAYGILGLLFLMSVKVIGRTVNGSTNWIALGPITLQPMEFVKISYIFFIASMLGRRPNFKRIFLTSLFCAAHVMVLILENDLGGALLYFVVFILMCYVATGRLVYLFGGAGAGVVAGWLAYLARPHVRTRFAVWSDPFADPVGKGYQMTQSLFAIGSGGWLGKGLTQGSPYLIPVVASDFIFAGIVEELGAVFAICLILIYIGIFIHFLRIAMDVEDRFYKLIGYGFSISFIFQVFLSVGGVIKFIPSTGVTLPLVSYGGSSVISTLAIFGIMQGVFMIAYKEDQEEEYREAGAAWFDETVVRDGGYMEGFRDGYKGEASAAGHYGAGEAERLGGRPEDGWTPPPGIRTGSASRPVPDKAGKGSEGRLYISGDRAGRKPKSLPTSDPDRTIRRTGGRLYIGLDEADKKEGGRMSSGLDKTIRRPENELFKSPDITSRTVEKRPASRAESSGKGKLKVSIFGAGAKTEPAGSAAGDGKEVKDRGEKKGKGYWQNPNDL